MKLFLDSDVVISSLLSPSGTANFLINSSNPKLVVSNFSVQELEVVAVRLKINREKLKKLLGKLDLVAVKQKIARVRQDYQDYVTDPNDAHIVAGAKLSKARFLITYNTRHFRIDKIKEDFKIIVITPANFLQYLRSQPS